MNQVKSPQIWTDEAVARIAAQDGYRLETPRETQKWLDFYREYDYLVREGW